MLRTATVLAVAAVGLVPLVAGHGIVTSVEAGGKTYGSKDGSTNRPSELRWPQPGNKDFGWVGPDDYANPDIICHKGSTPAPIHATVAAGSRIKITFNKWPAYKKPSLPGHKGPELVYLANCNGPCETADKTKLKFFKIYERGLVQPNYQPNRDMKLAKFATDEISENDNSFSFELPASIAADNYLLRVELIALHMASKRGGAQHYPSCFNLEITGSGTDRPEGVPGMELYKDDDPGIHFSMYRPDITSYPIPGPKLFTSGAAPSDTTEYEKPSGTTPDQTGSSGQEPETDEVEAGDGDDSEKPNEQPAENGGGEGKGQACSETVTKSVTVTVTAQTTPTPHNTGAATTLSTVASQPSRYRDAPNSY